MRDFDRKLASWENARLAEHLNREEYDMADELESDALRPEELIRELKHFTEAWLLCDAVIETIEQYDGAEDADYNVDLMIDALYQLRDRLLQRIES